MSTERSLADVPLVKDMCTCQDLNLIRFHAHGLAAHAAQKIRFLVETLGDVEGFSCII